MFQEITSKFNRDEQAYELSFNHQMVGWARREDHGFMFHADHHWLADRWFRTFTELKASVQYTWNNVGSN